MPQAFVSVHYCIYLNISKSNFWNNYICILCDWRDNKIIREQTNVSNINMRYWIVFLTEVSRVRAPLNFQHHRAWTAAVLSAPHSAAGTRTDGCRDGLLHTAVRDSYPCCRAAGYCLMPLHLAKEKQWFYTRTQFHTDQEVSLIHHGDNLT